MNRRVGLTVRFALCWALLGAALYLQWHGQITSDSYSQAALQTPIAHQLQAWLAG